MEKRFIPRKDPFVQRPNAVFLDQAERAFFRRLIQIRSVVTHDFVRHRFQNTFRLGGKPGSSDKNTAAMLFAVLCLTVRTRADELL